MPTINAPKFDDTTGTWAFPESWPAAARESWESMEQELLLEQRRLAEAQTAAEVAANAPVALIAAKRAELDKARQARETIERDTKEDAIYANLVDKHARVKRIRTPRGSIMMRAMTGIEVDASNVRMGRHKSDGDKVLAAREGLKASVLHPDLVTFCAVLEQYPGVWGELYEARDELITGRSADEGKDDAP